MAHQGHITSSLKTFREALADGLSSVALFANEEWLLTPLERYAANAGLTNEESLFKRLRYQVQESMARAIRYRDHGSDGCTWRTDGMKLSAQRNFAIELYDASPKEITLIGTMLDNDHLIAMLAADDMASLRNWFEKQLASFGLRGFIQRVVVPATTALGEAWASGRLEIYQEHLYTEMIKGMIRQALAEHNSDDGKPRVRAWGLMRVEGDTLYFGTANTKAVYQQLKQTPYAEYVVMNMENLSTLRVFGEVVFVDDVGLKRKILDSLPMLKNTYSGEKEKEFEVFYMRDVELNWFAFSQVTADTQEDTAE